MTDMIYQVYTFRNITHDTSSWWCVMFDISHYIFTLQNTDVPVKYSQFNRMIMCNLPLRNIPRTRKLGGQWSSDYTLTTTHCYHDNYKQWSSDNNEAVNRRFITLHSKVAGLLTGDYSLAWCNHNVLSPVNFSSPGGTLLLSQCPLLLISPL